MKKALSLLVVCFYTSVVAHSQFVTQEYKIFNHIDLGVTAGSTGIGLEASSPVGQYLHVRTGVDYVPQFKYRMKFNIQLGDEPVGKYDSNNQLTSFGKMAELMKDMTGYEPDDHVYMEGTPSMTSFKFLVDVLPFTNKKWHFTVGFYAGKHVVARAENVIEDTPTLVAVNMYNNIYDKVVNEEDLFMGLELPPDVCATIRSYGTMGMSLGSYKRDIFDEAGNLLHSKGDSYKLYPNDECMVKSKLSINKVRPYIGFGYGNVLSRQKKINCSFDCGVMYIGKTPHVYTHDGTCLTHEVENYGRSIREYMNFAKSIRVYPVVNFRIAYRLF